MIETLFLVPPGPGGEPAIPVGWDHDGYAMVGDGLFAVRFAGPRLVLDRETIPADGLEYAVARYACLSTAYFAVSGQVVVVEPEDGWAVLEIAADAPGAIPIQVGRETALVVALEAP